MRSINHIVIHCSATRANVDRAITLPGEDIGVREIDRWHRAQGWNGCGYHFVIRRDGTIETGRPPAKAGAHVSGRNADSLGLCLVGGISENGKSENNFEPPQWEALKALLARLHKQYPKAEIRGHRDFPNVAKDCPCFDVREWLRTIKL